MSGGAPENGADSPPPRRPIVGRPTLIVGAAFLAAAVIVIVALLAGPASRQGGGAGSTASNADTLAANPNLDPGSPLSGPAPQFTLTDQFGGRVALRSLRGRVVLLAFTDARCTATCPLTTATMLAAQRLLGPAGTRVALVGIDANPLARAVRDVRAYSLAHGMEGRWRFLTGSAAALRRVWSAYHVSVSVDAGQVEQTPALFVIDARGSWRRIYVTQQSYSTIGQQGRVVADEISSLLTGRAPSTPKGSLARIAAISPGDRAVLPRAGGGVVALGPGGGPRLLAFTASWLTATAHVRGEMRQLAGYERLAEAAGLARAVIVDEATVEPPGGTSVLGRLATGLRLDIAIDGNGRLADGYQVQDLPWLVLTSNSGAILWYWDASTQGWPSATDLVRHVRAALSEPAKVAAPGAGAARRLLAGSPAALAAIHAQAGQLLGGQPALEARLRSLRGYPIVLNAWASWCVPCQQEYPLLATAAVRYGREVAFLGVDTNDSSPANARAFLAAHPLSYPSYRSTTGALAPIAGLIGLPTTIYIDRAGRVACVRPGQYDAQGALDGDIADCALGGGA